MKKAHYAALLLAVLGVHALADNWAQQPSKAPARRALPDTIVTDPHTASLTTSDGKKFKLMLQGDCLPELFLNGEKIDKSDLPFYQDKLDILQKAIEERQPKLSALGRAAREQLTKQIISDIVEKRLVNDKEEVKTYYLTSSGMTINGKTQDNNIFLFFRNKYVKSDDMLIYYEKGGVYTFKKPTTP